uniref:Uncharacterized protein n=1 Tax=Caenorhabditis japonica TaxID=281687 RepID=A0A8R1DR42_CAEJA
MSPTDLLNAGLASHGLAEMAIDLLPTTKSVKIGVSHDGLRASYEGDGEAEIQVPMTIKKETKRILEILLPRLATAAESLNLENGMIGDEISDDQFAHLLQLLKEAPLKELTLSEIDLQRIRSWTLAM